VEIKKDFQMAKIEFIQPGKDEDYPASIEQVEVRVWGPSGESYQSFEIAGGVNFDASSNIWIEIIYSVGGIDFFRTRNFLHNLEIELSHDELNAYLERFVRGEYDSVGFGGMLPETSIRLIREKYDHVVAEGETETKSSYHLEIAVDTGSILGRSGPGGHMLTLRLNYINEEKGIQFMRELNEEIALAYEGKHPDPSKMSLGLNEWQFVRDLNQKAYDFISQGYQENYFSNPALTEMFDSWMSDLPSGSHVLDAGCGHGDPVISRLLGKEIRVTGIDLSAKMLERARASFPTVNFINQTAREIRSESEYEGACSLSSLLYLDPMDLSHSLYRLYRALKPGGSLFLYAYDLNPGWRGNPYKVDIHQWMWNWTYGMSEAAKILEEHGFFKVLRMEDVTTEEYKQERVEFWRKSTQDQYDELAKRYPTVTLPPPDLANIPSNLPYTYAMIARRIG
jgi:ubiquinone/menaquinone biosynthesis C-methylase UbiE